ncbi:ArnT family glycosyltransferase [Craurococcus roseus]|uniref:ArnT family glycosyltransferase n=1 Tax=Craurococcus roseus TaxID=77585 RepID=UPI0031E051D1
MSKAGREAVAPPRASALAGSGDHPTRLSWALTDAACAGWMVLAALLARGFGFIPSVLDPDESLYLLQAREWLRGGWPYVAVWDMHPVGAPAIIAAGLLAFGESIASVRLLGALFVAATGFLLFRITVLARCGRATGLAAGLLYVAHSVLPGGLATNTEILFAPFVTAGFALAMVAARDLLEERRVPGPGRFGSIGLCFGVALWIKQVAAPEACMAFLGLTALAVSKGGMPVPGVFPRALAFAAGCALPTAATALVYSLRGDLPAFLHANFVAPLLYVAKDADVNAMVVLRIVLASLLQMAWLLIAAAAAALALRRHRRVDLHAVLVAATMLWFAGATLGIVLPGKFYAHYFLLWVPPLSIAAALGLREVVVRMAPRRPGVALLGVVAIIASMPVLDHLALLGRRGVGLRLPDPPRAAAEAVSRLVPPGETAFVVNYEPIIYFLADLPLPTRMPLWQQLAGDYGGAMGQESDAELARVLASRPYLLVISQPHWRKVRRSAQHAIEAALEQGYQEAGSVQGTEGVVELWRRR